MATIFETITELSGIVTDAITAGNDSNIPNRLIRNTLIKVSTGKYYEVLPIIVPAECCIIGDELRSTNVQPRKASNAVLTPAKDFVYSFQGLSRMDSIIEDIVKGQTVTPTTGNTETQIQSWPYVEGPNTAGAVKRISRNIRKRIDTGLGDKYEVNWPKPWDMADPAEGWGRENLFINKKFIQEEVIAYIKTNYPNLKYSRTKCRQDVGFIIDSLGYDLTYGGNWQSVKTGEAYYEGTNLNIASSEKTATIAAYNFMKNLMQTIATNTTVTPVLNTNSITQIVTATNGDAGTQARIGTLMTAIVDIITNGSGSVAITYPDISGVSDALKGAETALRTALPTIQQNTIDFINGHFGTFQYNSAKCRRDLDKIISNTAYDVALGTNYNAVFQGLAYQRPNNAYNLNNQRVQTVGAIRNARDELKVSVTTDGSSSLDSSSNASTRISTAFNEIVDIIQNGSLGSAIPGDGVVNALSFPSPVGVDQNRVDAKDNLLANIDFMVQDVIRYIAINYPGLNYVESKCRRDVKHIINAQCYDVLYGGNSASVQLAESYFVDGDNQVGDPDQKTETAAAYDHLASIMDQIVREVSVTAQSGNTELQTTLGTPASATEGTEIKTNVEAIADVIAETTPLSTYQGTITYPDITWADAEYQTAYSSINSDKNDVIKSTVQYITNTYSGFVYNHTKCTRDIGYIVDAAVYDWALGSNFASLQAGLSYLRAPSEKVIGDQKAATLAANEYVKQQALLNVNSNATAIAGINSTWEYVQDAIFSGATEGGVTQSPDMDVYNATRQLELNKEFIVDEVLAYVDNYFKSTISNTVPATNEIKAATNWMFVGMPVKFRDQDDSTLGVSDTGLTADIDYYVREIKDDNTFTVSATVYGAEFDILGSSENIIVEKGYEYNRTLCARDVREYIDAIKWDLTWPQQQFRTYNKYGFDVFLYLPAFYKSHLAARYYVNAVIGSQEEDMYYLRNGTGLRLQTLEGLQGDLNAPNAAGYSLPTAGAYASLDPGWGPDDTRAWITARSPYVQNLTTFGYAATGQKIDGALHNGGNDSIVSNDFTQVISDGIGAWLLNNGRAEMVSVFTYYSHIGYLCQTGGRARATNGNNSYGTFGSVADGVDPDETPITAIVDNSQQYNATISRVITDGANELLQIEYSHAGNDYTEAAINFFGPGDSEEVIADEFRDNGVFQVRITEIDDSSGNPDAVAGGTGYLVVTNTAQTGTLIGPASITLANTDGNLSTAYPSMRVYITGGAGAGQFGIIETYNSGSKIATVLKERHPVTGGNFVIGQKYRIDSEGNTDFTAIGAANNNLGTIFTASGTGSGTGIATLLVDGWDHVVAGTTVVSPNSTSIYLIEPSIGFTPPTQSDTNHTITSDIWPSVEYYTTSAQYTNVATTTQSDGNGATFDVTRNGSKYYVSLNNGGEQYVRLDTVTIDGSDVGGATSTNDIVITITAINSVTGAVTDFDFSGYGQKGVFVALPDTNTTAKTSIDGQTWTTSTLNNNYTWQDQANGLLDDGSSTFKPSYAVALGTTGGQTVVNYSLNGSTWAAPASQPNLTASSTAGIAYGNVGTADNRFIIVADNDTDVQWSTDGGVSWTQQVGVLPSTGFTGIVYGKGRFIAYKSGSREIAYTENGGVTWTQELLALPATSAWSDIVFGNNMFVAVATDTTNAAYSQDGITWTTVAINSASDLPRQVAYGQGVFVVTTNDTGKLYYSYDGVYWPPHYAITATTYTNGLNAVAFGNPDKTPKFVAIQNSTTTAVCNAQIGSITRGRAGVANEQLFEVRITQPGSGYSSAPEMSVADPNNINDALFTVRTGDGVLAQPTFAARGSGFISASAEIDDDNSNGRADFFQNGAFVAVRQLSQTPVNGSNVVFDSLPGQVFKLVNTVSLVGSIDGSKVGFLQISPPMEIEDAPVDGDGVTMRIRFSQVRLTGHDFLDIGTGNFDDTNYPNSVYGDPVNEPDQNKETSDFNGGRVFFTSTDQDGNFRVGDLFQIEQATGVATLNAEAFNIAGLQELSLGEVTLGGNSASITEFSTDPFFTANSDTIVPTQRAIKSYIEAQIGGGGASLVVNSVTSGDIFIGGTQITTLTGSTINIKANVNFTKTVLGLPLAYNYFLR